MIHPTICRSRRRRCSTPLSPSGTRTARSPSGRWRAASMSSRKRSTRGQTLW
ncbi:hypothetical protein ACFPRL_12795 [Pseudoclavibacter helvolus]